MGQGRASEERAEPVTKKVRKKSSDKMSALGTGTDVIPEEVALVPLETSLYGLFAQDPYDRLWSSPSTVPLELDRALPEHVFVRPVSRRHSSRELPLLGGVADEDRASAPDPLPEIGTIVDKYRIDQLLGRGGFAVVYRATHLMLEMPVAIKLLRPSVVTKRPAAIKLLLNEARFAARISHPNVVRVFDVTSTNEIAYIVMEYIEGPSLGALISKRAPLPSAMVARIGVEVARGLSAGLDEGLIHRDIKPANIIIGKSGEAKVVDLGLARSRDVSLGDEAGAALRGSYVGTHGYMAPEQVIKPESVDFRADVYSLGASLYHAAVGRPPFPVKDAAACVAMHRDSPVPNPEELEPSVSPELSRIILWMLEKAPERRPRSYAELGDALTRLL
jgi:serine/threonine protein kinase